MKLSHVSRHCASKWTREFIIQSKNITCLPFPWRFYHWFFHSFIAIFFFFRYTISSFFFFCLVYVLFFSFTFSRFDFIPIHFIESVKVGLIVNGSNLHGVWICFLFFHSFYSSLTLLCRQRSNEPKKVNKNYRKKNKKLVNVMPRSNYLHRHTH